MSIQFKPKGQKQDSYERLAYAYVDAKSVEFESVLKKAMLQIDVEFAKEGEK